MSRTRCLPLLLRQMTLQRRKLVGLVAYLDPALVVEPQQIATALLRDAHEERYQQLDEFGIVSIAFVFGIVVGPTAGLRYVDDQARMLVGKYHRVIEAALGLLQRLAVVLAKAQPVDPFIARIEEVDDPLALVLPMTGRRTVDGVLDLNPAARHRAHDFDDVASF